MVETKRCLQGLLRDLGNRIITLIKHEQLNYEHIDYYKFGNRSIQANDLALKDLLASFIALGTSHGSSEYAFPPQLLSL